MGAAESPSPASRRMRTSLIGSAPKPGENGKEAGPHLVSLTGCREAACRGDHQLVDIAKDHQYLVGQMVSAMNMVCCSRFPLRSSPGRTQLENMQLIWLKVHRAARLALAAAGPGYAGAPFLLPSERGPG